MGDDLEGEKPVKRPFKAEEKLDKSLSEENNAPRKRAKVD